MSWRHTGAGVLGVERQLATIAGRGVGGQGIGVDPETAELVGGGRDDAERAAGRIGLRASSNVWAPRDEVRAGVLGANRARVAARADLLEHGLGRLEVGEIRRRTVR